MDMMAEKRMNLTDLFDMKKLEGKQEYKTHLLDIIWESKDSLMKMDKQLSSLEKAEKDEMVDNMKSSQNRLNIIIEEFSKLNEILQMLEPIKKQRSRNSGKEYLPHKLA
jgi:hypothetical protein